MSCQKRAGDPMVKGQDGMGAEVFVMPGTHWRQSRRSNGQRPGRNGC